MAITYQLAPMPKWYIADNYGRPLGGGYLATYYSIDKTAIFAVYEDINGQTVWPYRNIPNTVLQGIQFDENGSQGPFYWQIDSPTNPDYYYIEAYDSNGVLQWSIDNFLPPGAGGGGGGTTPVQVENLVANGVMYRNVGTITPPTTSPTSPYKTMLAPGAHQGFANNISNAAIAPYYTGPDIYFIKSNSAATDVLTYRTFSSSATSLPGDVTPVEYLNLTCSSLGAAETTKCVQFPITQNVYNLAGQQAVARLWARSNSGTVNISLQWLPFYGDGGTPTASVPVNIQTVAIGAAWTPISVSATIPALPSPLVLGTCGNDGLFLRVTYPFAVTCNIDITKPAVYLGTQAPTLDYDTYDVISTILDSPRTGDIKVTLDNAWLSTNNVCPFGWVFMNDGTIGSAASSATARAGIDSFPLYNLIWNHVDRAWAPIVGATTGSAVGDFNANLPLYLTRALGRVFAGTLNTEVAQTFTFTLAAGQTTATVPSSTGFITGVPIKFTTSGTLPSPLAVGTTYYAINASPTTIKFALTLADAVAGTAITFDGTSPPTAGTQTVTVTPYMLGQTTGEETHTLTIAEMPSHNHTTPLFFSGGNPNQAVAGSSASGGQVSTNNRGDGEAHNTLQPTTYMNVYIKL